MDARSSNVPEPPATPWWSLRTEAVEQELATHHERGLTAAEATQRLARFGSNELEQEPPISIWQRVFDQLNQLVIWILVAAAGVSAVIGDWIDVAAILAIVLLNVAIGVFQEEKAGRALAALRSLASPTVRLIRDGALKTVEARDVVPGDLLQLEAGDKIPADARLVKTVSLRAQEAALTGESTPVDKVADAAIDASTPLGERTTMAFMGTLVVAGRASALVVATGMHTELGHIAGLLQRYEPEPTPLQRRLTELGRLLIIICLLIVALVFVLQLYRGGKVLEVLLLSISLAVAAVPEGMPAVVTLTLAVGLQRMAKRNALIRRLPSVETLGAVTVICTDKTGTLTRNEMTVREVYAGGQHFDVSGIGYAPQGSFTAHGSTANEASTKVVDSADVQKAFAIAVHCNDAALTPPSDDATNWQIVGDPTEGALLTAAAKAGIEVNRKSERLHEIPFDSERKMMSVVVRDGDAGPVLYSKGAPEVILARCTHELRNGGAVDLTEDRRQAIRSLNADMAGRALRVLAVACRQLDSADADQPAEEALAFAGLFGMIDPPRVEVVLAVRECREAGVKPVMITGDHPDTALAIAREIGIAEDSDRLLTGAGLDEISDDQLVKDVPSIAVYARVSAKHKLQVIKAWQARNQVVAMTGDGVNDAPAVKTADIGVAMGVTGTDVTKETADMVLTDDNFASIIAAVKEGRGIYENIQKFVHYLLSCNASEVLLMLIAGVAGWPPPLGALHILWINLVTDGLPALALGMEPPERDIMHRAPRPRNEPVITRAHGVQILAHGLLMASVAAGAFWWIYRGEADRLMLAQSVAFAVMAFMQLLFSWACRSKQYTTPELGLFTNPYLWGAILISAALQTIILAWPAARRVFKLDADVLSAAPVILIAAFAPVTLVESLKLLRKAAGSRTHGYAGRNPP